MSDAPQARIGKYVLRREIARGGMGVVYEAEDPELGRRVALKVLREDGEQPGLVKRLHREATIAARVRHPHIVDIHEVGVAPGDDGVPVHFIAMEYVDGRTLADILRRRLPPRPELLRILGDVARAVGFAHEKGVIHRDIKPSNVLVDHSGRVVLSDFGLARAESFTSRLTRSQAVLGTPYYMAPEQVEGRIDDVDRRTDIYALGVVLYEVLTGNLPFRDETPAKLYSQILNHEPVPPTRRDPSIEKDLEVICLKAMEKEPGRRYASAEAFARDLARFRAGEEIAARPPSRIHRIWKFVKRRRAVMLAVAAGLVAAAGVAAFLAPRWLREKSERERIAREAQAELDAQRELGTLWMAVLLAKQGLYQQGEDPARVRLQIQETIIRVDVYIAGHPARPQGYYVRGRARLYLDELEEAEADLRKAAALDGRFAPAHALLGRVKIEQHTRRLYGDPRTLPHRQESLASLLEEAREALARGGEPIERWGLPRTREDDVAEVVARALAVRHVERRARPAAEMIAAANEKEPSEEYCNLLGGWAETLELKIAWQTRAIAKMPHYAKAHYDRGTARHDSGDRAGALEDFNKALEIHPRLVIALLGRAGALLEAGRVDDALRDFERALEIDDRCAMAHVGRGDVRRLRKDLEGALRDYDRAIEIDPRHVEAYVGRGRALRSKGDRDGAIREFTRALEIFPRYALAFFNRGTVRRAIEDFDRAIDLDPRMVEAYVERGLLKAEEGKTDEAFRDFDRAVEINPRLAEAYKNRGDLRRDSGDAKGAIEDYGKALEIDPRDAGVLNDRGLVRQAMRDYDGAIRDYTRAIEIDPRYIKAFVNRGMARSLKGDVKGALEDIERALEIDSNYVGAYINRGTIRQVSGDLKGAVDDYGRAIALDPKLAEPYVNRGMARAARGEHREALEDFTKALEVAPARWPHREQVVEMQDQARRKLEGKP